MPENTGFVKTFDVYNPNSSALSAKFEDTEFYQYPSDLGKNDNRGMVLFTIYKINPNSLQNAITLLKNTNRSDLEQSTGTGGFGTDIANSLGENIINDYHNTTFDQATRHSAVSSLDPAFQNAQYSTRINTRINKASEKVKQTIAIYMPIKIESNSQINYSDTDFGTVRKIVDFSNLKTLGGATERAIKNSLLKLGGKETTTSITGRLENPRTEMLFGGVSKRTFNFNYEFAPKNETESLLIYEIIKIFRYYAHPNLTQGGIYFDIPAEFQIEYYEVQGDDTISKNLFLNKIGRCVLSSINIDYTPPGVTSFHEDGSPTLINMQMQFSEIETLTQNHVREGF